MQRMDIDALLADLDPDQRAAVTTESHLVAVVAGAGSGKTRVLTRRIAYRIATGDADARHTLALTFTREAAGELRRRLTRLGVREQVEAGTFHSLMLAILRQRWTDTERRPKTVAPDRRRLLRDAQKEYALGGGHQIVEVANDEIGWAMARGISADGYGAAARRHGRRPSGGIENLIGVFEAYVKLKRKRGVVDFDDVLADVLADAARDPDFADTLRWRFRHLLVDEAQDLNPVQHRLVDLLRRGRDDLFLVGDPAQAVYGFNGADPTLLRDVETRFPGVEIVRLPVNHRCTPQIVRLGTHVLTNGGQPARIESARDDGPPVRVLAAEDETAEAEFIATRIALGDPNLIRGGNVAVLARTNAQLSVFEAALMQSGLSVRRSTNGVGSPLQTAMREAASMTSPSALRGWAHDTLDDIASLEQAQTRVDDLERRTRDARSGRATGASRQRQSVRAATPHAAQMSEAQSLLAFAQAERKVATSLLDFLRDHPRGDGAEFRSWVAITNPFDDKSTDGIELLSFHAAKGREWHTVFVAGVETGLMPHKSATTADTRAEEARLLYVAATRATDALTLSYSERRAGYARQISPLLAGFDPQEPEPTPPPRELFARLAVDPAAERLRAWRAAAAIKARVVPTQLLTDRDLNTIAALKPMTADEIDAAISVGPLTAQRLAADILAALSDAPPLDDAT
jgi:DNA helicase II / ATP-dependent DNA helicase PcrA